MFDKAPPPPPPDYTPLANASKEQSEKAFQLQQQQFDWAKKTYEENKGNTDLITKRFLEDQETNRKNAAKDRERYETVFQPLEESLANEARDFASPERKAKEMGRAQAGVAQQFDAQRANATRDLESYGINPGATRFAALDTSVRAQQAATEAAAGEQAYQQTDATGRALRSEAINVGRGYPGQIAGTYGTSANFGGGANNAQLATTASGANTMGTGMQWGNMGMQGLGQSANILNTGYGNQLAYNKAQNAEAEGWGNFFGLLGGAGLKAATGSSRPWWAAEGGMMPGEEDQTPGGAVPTGASPTQGRAIDDVPARLTAGEFVLPKDVTSWLGEEKLQKMIEKARMDKQGAGAKPTQGRALDAPPKFQSRRGALPVGAR